MRHFTSAPDKQEIERLIKEALNIKTYPLADKNLGLDKLLGLVFMNPSLRTRLSTQRAAYNLGMNTSVINMSEGWGLETEDGVPMTQKPGEHIREAAPVIGQYCDIIGIRSFPTLKDRERDYSEIFIKGFKEFAGVPVVSLESEILHPLQSLADLMTIEEQKPRKRPKVALTWVPHVKALPQAVPNSLCQWMQEYDEADFIIANPEGYDLSKEYTGNIPVTHKQDEALEDADFVYAKNWSSYQFYGEKLSRDELWQITPDKMKLTNNGKFMHCLPVRRNLVVSEEVLDSDSSIVQQQAANRLYSAQAVLKALLQSIKG